MEEDKELEKIKRMMMGRLIKGEKGLWNDGEVIELTEAKFDKAIASAKQLVLVDFWAGWCAPCIAMKPVMEALARDYAGKVYFAKVDVDKNRRLAQKYNVMGIPFFILFQKGRPIDQITGAVGRQGLESMLKKRLT
jgi:thioredoxin 1